MPDDQPNLRPLNIPQHDGSGYAWSAQAPDGGTFVGKEPTLAGAVQAIAEGVAGRGVPCWPGRTANAGHRPVGLPLPSTAPLTAKEREALRQLARTFEIAGARVSDALETNRVDRALEAVTLSADAGDVARRLAVEIGRNR